MRTHWLVVPLLVVLLLPGSAVAAELTVVGQFGGVLGAAPGQFQSPDDLATDSAGNVYVADTANNRIQKVAPDGQFLLQFGISGGGAGQLAGPTGVALDSAGNSYVADRNNHRVMQFDTAGTFVQGWGWGVDTGAGQLQVCTTASTCNIGTAGNSSINNGQFFTPQAIAVDAFGDVYVSEFAGDQRVQRFDPSPVTYETGWGAPCGVGPPCSAPSEFARPASLALDATPNVFVGDRDNSRVQKFSSGGGFLAAIGSDGAGDGQMDSAKDVAVDPAGNLFVADVSNFRIQKFTGDGVFLTTYTLPQPDFFAPAALTFSPQGDLYVIDSASGHNFRILRLREPAAAPGGPGGPPAPSTLPAPVLGKTVNVELVAGKVRVGVRGGAAAGGARAAQKGVRFVPLTEGRQIPVGSFLDTKKGTVRLTSAADDAGKTQAGTFTKGLFQVLQARSGKNKGLTKLGLKGSSFKNCTAGSKGKGNGKRALAARKRLGKGTVRRLQGNAEGRFQSRGKHSSATVRGTIWTVTDRCDGTLTTVKRGKVAVRDFRRKTTVVVGAGKRYLAKAG